MTNWSVNDVNHWLEANHVNEESRLRLVDSAVAGKELLSLEAASLKVGTKFF